MIRPNYAPFRRVKLTVVLSEEQRVKLFILCRLLDCSASSILNLLLENTPVEGWPKTREHILTRKAEGKSLKEIMEEYA